MADTRPSLNVLSGPLAGQRFVIEDAVDNILIGSDPSCGIHLDSPGVSPIHARLWIDLDGAKVYDTNSPTGVYVNDDRVVKEAPVRNGDILWLGPPGEEGSVLIQCILPPPAAAAPPPVLMAPTLAETDDTSATVVGVPAYRPDDLEELTPPPPPPPRPAAAAPAEDIDSTVVMSSGPLVDPSMMDLVGESPTVAYRPGERPRGGAHDAHDASNLVDDGPLEVVDEPISPGPPPLPPMPPPIPSYAAAPPPVSAAPASAPADDMGFPEFEVEPTVVMPPPQLAPAPPSAQEPVRFNVPLPTSAPAPEFEDELAETVLDVPAPAMPPRPAPPASKDADAEEDDTAATVMYHASDMPVPAPPAPPAPPRAASPASPAKPPAAGAPPVPPRAATAGALAAAGAAAAAGASAARPAAEAKPPAPPRPAAPAPGAAARPAAPAPRPRPAAAAAPAPAAPRGGGGKGAMIAAGAGVVVVLLLAGGYFAMRSKGTTTAEVTPTPAAPAITTPPTTIAAVAPPVTEAVAPPVTEAAAPTTMAVPTTLAPVAAPTTLAGRTPPPSPRVAAVPATLPGQRPGAVPTGKPVAPPVTAAPAPNPAQQTAAAVANLLSQAQAASASKNYDAAVTLYDEVLKLQPGNGPATSGRAAAVAAKSAASAARRAFVSGRTVVQAEKAKGGGGVSGFDSSDVSVVKSPDFQGRLEFAMNPPSVKPGDSYRLQIALVNEGKKPIKVSGMTFTITANGQKTGNPIAPRVKEVAPGQRAVLEELPGVFPEASTWTAEVLVTANKGDSLKNQLTWK